MLQLSFGALTLSRFWTLSHYSTEWIRQFLPLPLGTLLIGSLYPLWGVRETRDQRPTRAST